MLIKSIAAFTSIFKRFRDIAIGRKLQLFHTRLALTPPYGVAAGTIAVNVTQLERGFNACKTPRLYIHLSSTFLRYSKLLVENCAIFILHLCLAAPHGVTPSEFREDLDIHQTRMNGLSCGEESITICSAVLIQYTSVWRTDGRTNARTDVQAIAITCFSIADACKKFSFNCMVRFIGFVHQNSVTRTTSKTKVEFNHKPRWYKLNTYICFVLLLSNSLNQVMGGAGGLLCTSSIPVVLAFSTRSYLYTLTSNIIIITCVVNIKNKHIHSFIHLICSKRVHCRMINTKYKLNRTYKAQRNTNTSRKLLR